MNKTIKLIMNDLYEMIKSFESDTMKISNDGCIHIYINGQYPEEFVDILKEYGKTHHLRMRRLYHVDDGFSLDRLFIAKILTKRGPECRFMVYG